MLKLNHAANTAEVLTAALNQLTGLGASYQITAYIGSVKVSSNECDSLQAIQRELRAQQGELSH